MSVMKSSRGGFSKGSNVFFGASSLRGSGFFARAGQYRSWNYDVVSQRRPQTLLFTNRNPSRRTNDGELCLREGQGSRSSCCLELGFHEAGQRLSKTEQHPHLDVGCNGEKEGRSCSHGGLFPSERFRAQTSTTAPPTPSHFGQTSPPSLILHQLSSEVPHILVARMPKRLKCLPKAVVLPPALQQCLSTVRDKVSKPAYF